MNRDNLQNNFFLVVTQGNSNFKIAGYSNFSKLSKFGNTVFLATSKAILNIN